MAEINSIIFENNMLKLIDQRKLPTIFEYFTCTNYRDVEYAIREMVVRGAPAIGATAAYGTLLLVDELIKENLTKVEFNKKIDIGLEFLNNSRPTAVNLMWAINKMKEVISTNSTKSYDDISLAVKKEAILIHKEDIETNKRMAKHGAKLINQGDTILTHCNTGALATAGYGTALGVIREAFYQEKNIFVYADETRPRLQGARLTAWELMEEGIPSKLIVDSAAATLIRDKKIDIILVGADRIALNGDSANKIGTFMLSVIAEKYNIPFYIVAPTTTIDFDIVSGGEIVIEERPSNEITIIGERVVAPAGMEVYNPAFDVTPNDLINGIVTEKGIIYPPFEKNIIKLKNNIGD
ncbi:S-methyl-5-thioribose-1-phosphate isomerase [Helicovermis profundi]|uniref:Methylthioribose-1-phosphate isomerase n=1 Tax=Helicovermis profundi TaxID=3065157 RepID=A0AAU9E3E5_9FIRM|nr:S-methyl-5-thioribose-1-phosphate isomerase [Clostridia bacterium S502]